MTYSTVKLLVSGQLDVRERPLAARLDGRLEDRVELVARDHELPRERRRSASTSGPVPGKRFSSSSSIGLEVRLRIRRRDGVVERLRLLVERQPLAFEHPHARGERGRAASRGTGGASGSISSPPGGTFVRARAASVCALARDRVERQLARGSASFFQSGWTVVGVDVVRVVLAHGQHELHVAAPAIGVVIARCCAAAEPTRWRAVAHPTLPDRPR